MFLNISHQGRQMFAVDGTAINIIPYNEYDNNCTWGSLPLNYACKRVQEIVTDFSYDGCTKNIYSLEDCWIVKYY